MRRWSIYLVFRNQRIIRGYLLQKLVLRRQYLCHYALTSVAEHEQRYLQLTVVDSGLVKDLLREVHGRCFKLNEHERLHLSVINNGIATLLHTRHLYGHFHGYETVRITELIHQQLQGRLAHQFLWREADIPPPPRAKYILFAVLSSYLHRL